MKKYKKPSINKLNSVQDENSIVPLAVAALAGMSLAEAAAAGLGVGMTMALLRVDYASTRRCLSPVLQNAVAS